MLSLLRKHVCMQEFLAVLSSLQQVLALMAAQSRPQPETHSSGHRYSSCCVPTKVATHNLQAQS